MSATFFPTAFAGFGPNRLYPWPEPNTLHQVHARPGRSLRAAVRQECPRHPGVYGMVNARNELIYVGKAKSLRTRLLSYFRKRGQDPRARRIIQQARSIVWEFAPSDFAALLRELELIRRWQPRCNVQGQPRRRRRTFLCLGRRPAPYAFLSARPPSGAVACFGPLFSGPRATEAVRRLNDWFGLRDCPQKQEMVFADQAELFPVLHSAGCLRLEIGTCLGPCAAACSRTAYDDRVQAARAFLEGNDRTPLDSLHKDMSAASEAMAFERAGMLRDKLAALQWLFDHLDRLRQARDRHTCIYPVSGHGGRDLWYLIRRGWVAAALPTPRDDDSRRAAEALIESVYGQPSIGTEPTRLEEIDGVLLVAAWFRKRPEERTRAINPHGALLRPQGFV
ncbi:MAG: GIY-YIG nuclease family protein [Gemmataceae bacterium]|nr:GIY-YIG nuclease family protein [Gemmataceae bacterium]